MEIVIEKSSGLAGELRVPGDKSISHRAAMLGAVSDGPCRISGYSPSTDCESTLRCLASLGVSMKSEEGRLYVEGRGEAGLSQPEGILDAGNSGTTMRLLAGLIAGYPLNVKITGDSSLLSRPMARIVEPLSMMGARVSASDDRGCPPLEVDGGNLAGIEYTPGVASAQVKSSVLLAALRAEGPTTIREIARTRNHTELMMEAMGLDLRVEGLSVTIHPGIPSATDFEIPGDISSAAFLIAAAIVCPESRITIRDVGLNETRTWFLELVKRMGARLKIERAKESAWEKRGDVTIAGSSLSAVLIDGRDVALAVDEIPLIAMLATQAEGTTRISGAGELRLKESDRISHTVEGLSRMGAEIYENEDGMTIKGPCELRGEVVDGGGDHRIAMMLAVAGLSAKGKTRVRGWEWTEVSFPDFARAVADLGGRIHGQECG